MFCSLNREKLVNVIIAVCVMQCPLLVNASTDVSWKSFIGGALTTLAVHEASHIVAANSYGADVDVDGLSLVYPGFEPTPRQQMRIASAGFQGQWLASELAFSMLSSDTVKNNKPKEQFYSGIVAGHIAISTAYILLKEDARSDIYAMSNVSGLSRNEVLALLLIPAGIDAARLWMDDAPAWLQTVSITSKGLGIAAVWNF